MQIHLTTFNDQYAYASTFAGVLVLRIMMINPTFIQARWPHIASSTSIPVDFVSHLVTITYRIPFYLNKLRRTA